MKKLLPRPKQSWSFLSLGLILQVFFISQLLASVENTVEPRNIDEVYCSLHLENASIEKVFKELERKTSFNFTYDHNDLDQEVKISIQSNNISLKEVLLNVSKESALNFRQINNVIDVFKVDKHQRIKKNDRVETFVGEVVVTGKVVSQEDGEALPGVNIIIKGTRQGTVSDLDGNFRIAVPGPKTVLVFSSVGFSPQEITVGSQSVINVTMTTDIQALEEIVIVGYGVQKKESVVGAITQMDNERLLMTGVQDVTNAIAGELSGVLTIQNSGEPGAAQSEIIIRGLSSWNGSQPLVLVDGVERDFSDMDPNEIESISVLKDASATAVFGAKGANGVIIVTTRRGKMGKPRMEVTTSYGFQKPTRIPNHIDSYTTMEALNVAYMNNGRFQDLMSQQILDEYRNPTTALNALRYPNVDWFDMLTNWAAPTANANLNISGGTEFAKYFCSIGYYHSGDFFKAYDDGEYNDTHYRYDRYNLRMNTDFNLTPTTVLSFNIGGEADVKNEPRSSMWRNLYATSPARFPAYFPSWMLNQYPDLDYPDARGDRLAQAFGEYTGNPYSTAYDGSFRKYEGATLFTDLILDQDLSGILDGLSTKAKISMNTYSRIQSLYANYEFPNYQFYYDVAERNEMIREKQGAGNYDPAIDGVIENPWYRNGQGDEVWVQNPLDINVGGLQNDYYRNLYYEISLNYSQTFGKHNVTGLALFNRQQNRKSTSFPYYYQGLVGRVTYDFDHKYLVEFNLGYTGSERFAPGNRYGFFPSAAIGWTISEEDFFINALPMFNFFKIRYSDGLVGSDNADNRWLYISNFERDNRGRYMEGKAANLTAQWEEARKRDIGVEFGLFDDMISGAVDFFHERRTQMLLGPRSVTMLVGQSFKELNLGELKKHGFEIELEYNRNVGRDFNWFVRGIFGYNENRILFRDDPVNTPEYKKDAGKPLGAQTDGVLLTGNGYYQTVDDINNYVSPISKEKLVLGDYKFLDYNSDGVIDPLDKYPIEGSLYPPITYSITPGFTWKNFSFNVMLQGNHGKFVDYNMTFEAEFLKGDWRIHESQREFWTPYNQNVNHSTLHYSGSSSADILFWGGGEADRGYDIMIKDRYWRDASYLRVKKIFASYNFQSKQLQNLIGVDALNVYVTANNVYTFTNLLEGDPERKDFYQGFYPQMSQYNLGLKLGF